MKTPQSLTYGDFSIVVVSFLADHCSSTARARGLTCKHCGSQILTKPVVVLLHEADPYRCIETGVVQPMRIPYCPKCEFPPVSRGCIHVPSLAKFLEWCSLDKDVGQLILIDGKPLTVVDPKKPTSGPKRAASNKRTRHERRSGRNIDQQIDSVVKAIESTKEPAARKTLQLRLDHLRDRLRKFVRRKKTARRSAG